MLVLWLDMDFLESLNVFIVCVYFNGRVKHLTETSCIQLGGTHKTTVSEDSQWILKVLFWKLAHNLPLVHFLPAMHTRRELQRQGEWKTGWCFSRLRIKMCWWLCFPHRNSYNEVLSQQCDFCTSYASVRTCLGWNLGNSVLWYSRTCFPLSFKEPIFLRVLCKMQWFMSHIQFTSYRTDLRSLLDIRHWMW